MSSTLRFFTAAVALLLCGTFTGLHAQVQIQPGQVLISEVRLAGEGGAQDEYIELYNNTNNDIFVQATDTSGGWAVAVTFGGITGPLYTIPNGTRIPARGHLLGANPNGYSLTGYPSGYPPTPPPVPNGFAAPFPLTTPDRTWDFDVAEGDQSLGIALFSTTSTIAFTAATRLDAFGMIGAPALYKEGNGYPNLPLTRTLVRDMRTPTGAPKDTGDNAADFLLLNNLSQLAPLAPGELLGAPGPENLNSPVAGIHLVKASLLDPMVGSNNSPNRERRPNFEPNANLGTLLIRRKFTNNGTTAISRLRFRAIDITGPGSDNTCGGPLCADVRLLTSQDEEAGSPNIGVVTVRGLTLEEPPRQSDGGGFNSSVSANSITLSTPLAPGASINVTFKLGVMRIGSFRLLVNTEAQSVVSITAPSARFAARKGSVQASEGVLK
jgi:hypothetical protein